MKVKVRDATFASDFLLCVPWCGLFECGCQTLRLRLQKIHDCQIRHCQQKNDSVMLKFCLDFIEFVCQSLLIPAKLQ